MNRKINLLIKGKKNSLLVKKIKSASEPIILAIDTSCDDTSVAVLSGRRVLSNVVSSQIELHKKWGGVVPDIARRAHRENIEGVYLEALKRARIKESDYQFVAVTYGPGLSIALEVGIEFAKKLATTKNKKLIPINHMEGHLLAFLAQNRLGKGRVKIGKEANIFPALALLVSGNHSEIVKVNDVGRYQLLGETLDDAAGEAFDKVARMLDLGYPGGPIITFLAKKASARWKNSAAGLKARGERKPLREVAGYFGLPIPMINSGDFNFSFSGLKTASLYKIKDLREKHFKDTDWSHDFAREFINAVCRSLLTKLEKAIKLNPDIKSIIIGGGVSNNEYLIRETGALARKLKKQYLYPEVRFRSDNAAMIGLVAYYRLGEKKDVLSGKKVLSIDRDPMLSL